MGFSISPYPVYPEGVYMSPVYTTLQDIESYSLDATLQVGGNGNPDGGPTSAIGDVNGAENWANYPWDSDPINGFDTGTVPVSFDDQASGNETLTVASQSPLSYAGAAMGDVSSVVIEAATQIPAQVQWSSLDVEFLQNGSVVQNINIGNGPNVNTINTPSFPVADQTMTVTPQYSNCDQVIVTGNFRMQSPGINAPPATAMYANVFVTGSGI